MMKWKDVMKLFGSPDYSGQRTDFVTMRAILSDTGSPENHLRFVHVAGTNGKGSACRMMQAVLTESGYRTGLYTSPHLEFMNERWSVDGTLIADEEILETAGRVRKAVEKWNAASGRTQRPVRPTAFELLTMMAFVWFEEQHCDIVILEVGIGGRTDATNIIPVPECAMIMNIGLEHTEQLGSTPEAIAWQKGGIIKPGGDVILYHQDAPVETVISSICREKNARLVITSPAEAVKGRAADTRTDDGESACAGQVFSYRQRKDLLLGLGGSFQIRNALAVLDAVDVLRAKGWTVPEGSLRKALASVTWPGRFETVSTEPLIIADGAHNPNGIQALVDAIRCEQLPDGCLAGRSLLFVVGIMADKDTGGMLKLLAPLASRFILEAPPNERADSPENLSVQVRRIFNGPVNAAGSIEEAMRLAVSFSDSSTAVICCGSLFQIAGIRRFCVTTHETIPPF